MPEKEFNREEWLKDSEAFFRNVKSYNSTIITVGYATFFAALLFLSQKTSSSLIFWAMICLVASAAIFVSYELLENIKLAVETRKAGKEEKRFFRFWVAFFVPSLVLGVFGLAVLVWLIILQL